MADVQYVKIIEVNEVDSTNNYARNLAEQGADEITVVRACAQTDGRGQMGRQWVSPRGKGIYTSVILRPHNRLVEFYDFPAVCALAVVRALKAEVPGVIKSPNDVLVGFKKIAGVLVETRGTAEKVDYVIAGIGININTVPGELPETGTSLYIENQKLYSCDTIFKLLMSELIIVYREFYLGHVAQLRNEIAAYKQ